MLLGGGFLLLQSLAVLHQVDLHVRVWRERSDGGSLVGVSRVTDSSTEEWVQDGLHLSGSFDSEAQWPLTFNIKMSMLIMEEIPVLFPA